MANEDDVRILIVMHVDNMWRGIRITFACYSERRLQVSPLQKVYTDKAMFCPNCRPENVVHYRHLSPELPTEATVAQLEAEMKIIGSMMERLRSRRAVLQRRINALSSISQLPAEILTEIFRMTCQLSQNNTNQVITPLFFGGICKEWRDIAWSTPLLWNNISINVSRRTHTTQINNLLTEWLLRAKTSPLYIKLTSDEEHETIFCSLRAIMDVLVTRAPYWHGLDALLPPQCHDTLKGHEFPLLTSVSLRPPKGTISTFSEPPSMFLSAPNLIDVDLSGYNFSAMVLPWGQLRRFKTQFLTVAECLKLLRRSPTLKECYLESVYSPEIFDSLPSETLYSDLELLNVFLIKSAAISLLDNLTLPNLRVLNVHNSGSGGSLHGSICSLVSRSSCYLQRLSIERTSENGMKDDDVIACLEALPSLSHFRLVFRGADRNPSIGLSDKLVSRLRPPSSHQGQDFLVPRLASLEYRGSVRCDCRLLVEVLSKRWCAVVGDSDGASRLVRAEIVATTAYDIPDAVREDLDKLIREGMQVEIRSTWNKLIHPWGSS